MEFMTPRQYGQLLFRVFFNGRSLLADTENLARRQVVESVVQANVYTFIFAVLIMTLIYRFYDLQFDFWIAAVCIAGCIALGVASCISGGIEGGILWGVLGGWLGGVLGTIVASIREDFKFGIFCGILIGTTVGFTLSVALATDVGVERIVKWRISVGFLVGFLICAALSSTDGLIAISFLISYFIFWSRWFYLPVLLIPFFFEKMEPRKLPCHWDENICLPLPFLNKTLWHISINNRTSAINEAIFLIYERPTQRKASQQVMMKIAVEEMVKFRDLRNIANLKQELDFLPRDLKIFPEYYNRWYEELSFFSVDVQMVYNELNSLNRLHILERIVKNLREFQRKMDFATKEIGIPFGKISNRWLDILEKEFKQIATEIGRLLQNPFVVGNPISAESEIFVGRRDIITQIQQEALKEGGAGAILFIGRRRTGKTSTLLNLKRYLLTNLSPAFIDCQNPTVFGNLEYFSRAVARAVSNSLTSKIEPQQYWYLIFELAQLTDFLDDLQSKLQTQDQHLLLCFDEYERLTEKIVSGEFAGLPDAFRCWVQHLPRTICLFAGSHALSEIGQIDWTDYFINVRTIRISFLDFDSALRLVTEPIPQFDLQYESGLETAKALVRRLGCQPFLLQATMSELVNYLNTIHRKTASQADIDIAIDKLFESQSTYFNHIWKTETSDIEKEALQAIIKQQQMPLESDPAIRSLIRKEVLRKEDHELVFCVPVFREWITKNQVS